MVYSITPKISLVCDRILFKYKQDKNVLGVMLFGSAARNKSDRYSDIDIYILLKKKGVNSRVNFIENGFRVDIVLDSLDEAEAYLKEDRHNVRRNTSHMLAHGVIIYGRTQALRKIQKAAEENLTLKTKYSQKEILMHKYSIDDFWGEIRRDFKNRDYVAFGLNSQLLLNNILELFMKLKRSFFRQPNEMSIVLDQLDRNFGRMLKRFYASEDLRAKKRVLAELVKYIYKKSNGALPEKWRIKN